MKKTLKNIVIGTTIVCALMAIGYKKKHDANSLKEESNFSYKDIGDYKGYALCNPEVIDMDDDGKVDILINPDREKILGLDFHLETTRNKYRKALIKTGHLGQYAGESIEVVSEDFFDEMFP